MLVTSLGLALLSVTAVSSTVVRTDDVLERRRTWLNARQDSGIAAVNQSINSIGASLAAANNTLVAFEGSIGGLIDVNGAINNLGDTITAATNTIQQTPQLSPIDSANVGISFLFLQPNINQLLANLNAKQPQFINALYGIIDTRSLIRDTLVIQQNGSAAVGSALINILDPTLRGIAQPVNDQIQGNFTAAVQFWEGRSGLIQIPSALVPAATDLLASVGPAIEGIFGAEDVDSGSASVMEQFAEYLHTRQDGPQYCCGITQEQIDALGPNENDVDGVPLPIRVALRIAGIID